MLQLKYFTFFTSKKLKSNYQKLCKTRFTTDNIITFSYFDHDNTLYGTNTGKVYLYNHIQKIVSLVCDVSGKRKDGIKSIQTYQRECFVGTNNGYVYLIPLVSQKEASIPQLITIMSCAVSNLDIFGNGLNRYLYTANIRGRLCGYIIDQVRSQFKLKRRVSISNSISGDKQKQETSKSNNQIQDQIAKHYSEQEESSFDNVDLELSDHGEIVENDITPVFTKKYKNEIAKFMYGFQSILAYCSQFDANQGKIRFFNQMTQQLLWKYQFDNGYPMSCYSHNKIQHGQEYVSCEVSLSNGEAYSFNILAKSVTQMYFYQLANLEKVVVKYKPRKSTEFKKSLSFSTSKSDQLVRSEDHVNDILSVINQFNEIEQSSPQEVCETETNSIYKVEQLAPIKFKWGIPSIWYYKKMILIADYESVYIFQKIQIEGKTDESYIQIQKDNFRPYPNRVELEEMNEQVHLYTSYNKGYVTQGILDFENLQWHFNILE